MAVFEISEMLKVAIKDEEIGEAFYNAIAGRTSDERLKERLLQIAKQEVYHAARFRNILTNVKDSKPREQYQGEYDGYMNALLTNRAFPDIASAIAKASKADDGECLDIAKRLEKDTILFYEELIKFVPSAYAVQINEIMNEERNHLADLTSLRA